MSESAAIQGYLTRSAQASTALLRAAVATDDSHEGGGFASMLRQASRAASRPEKAQHEMLREAAGQLVANAFILPLLQTMHDSPLRPQSGPFAAGTAEKRFMPLLDQQFADRVTQSNQFPLVDSVVRHLSKLSQNRNAHATA